MGTLLLKFHAGKDDIAMTLIISEIDFINKNTVMKMRTLSSSA